MSNNPFGRPQESRNLLLERLRKGPATLQALCAFGTASPRTAVSVRCGVSRLRTDGHKITCTSIDGNPVYKLEQSQ